MPGAANAILSLTLTFGELSLERGGKNARPEALPVCPPCGPSGASRLGPVVPGLGSSGIRAGASRTLARMPVGLALLSIAVQLPCRSARWGQRARGIPYRAL